MQQTKSQHQEKVKFTRFNNINHIYKSSMDIVESQNCITSFSCVTTIMIFFISLNLENAFLSYPYPHN